MQHDFTLDAYNYHLPEENIAQNPADKRDDSRLLLLDKDKVDHKNFKDITELIAPGDLVVINDTQVFPARLLGNKPTGGKVEVFLLNLPVAISRNGQQDNIAQATALIKSSKRPRVDSQILISEDLTCTIAEHLDGGKALVNLYYPPHGNLYDILSKCGHIPLPPYIERKSGTTDSDKERYQTVYAQHPGAVAAPTAGLHFTTALIESLAAKGVFFAKVTLHVGYGTFSPVRVENIEEHQIHQEYVEITKENAEVIQAVKKKGGKLWAIGTTTVRALEYAADTQGVVQPTKGWCNLYIVPGYQFKVIDNLITNFHLPCSSLLFLVSALCGRTTLLAAYKKAIEEGYRFYSYGDAMAILR